MKLSIYLKLIFPLRYNLKYSYYATTKICQLTTIQPNIYGTILINKHQEEVSYEP